MMAALAHCISTDDKRQCNLHFYYDTTIANLIIIDDSSWGVTLLLSREIIKWSMITKILQTHPSHKMIKFIIERGN